MNNLVFKPIPGHEQGLIFRMLQAAYVSPARFEAGLLAAWAPEWQAYDAEIFDAPDTVGAAGFVTYLGPDIIGFASWDPRQHPTGIIGHNCILPEFRGNGYGQKQVAEVLRRLQAAGFTRARVATGDLDGFLPAQKMYLACGFRETKRISDPRHGAWQLIEFEKELLQESF